MPAPLHANTNSGVVTVTTTTETVVATLSSFSPDNPQGEGVCVTGDVVMTTGAAATTVTLRIRQGTGITGTTVFTSPAIPVTAAAVTPPLGFTALDNSALALNDPAGLQYVLTVQQASATGNGSVAANNATVTAQSATQPEA